MRHHLVLLIALTGCKYLDQPKKVNELEKRLDEVSGALSELTGEPVGQRPGKASADADDERGAKGKKARGAKRKDPKATRGAKTAKAAQGEDARPAQGTKVARRDRDEDDEDADDEDEDAEADADADERRDDEGDGRDQRIAERRALASERAASAIAPAAAKAPPADVPWGYQPADGPDAWATLHPSFAACGNGEQQSPIDIMPRRSQAPEVIFVYKPTAGTVVDDGHGLEVDLAPGSFMVVDGTRFDLIELQLHTPSEHTVAGDSFPMELHLIHRSKAGALAVIGVLFTEGEPSSALAPVWKGAPKARGSSKLKKMFDPEALLPREHAAYRYDGSLTTPPCTEGVIWHVFKRPRTEDEQTIAAFRRRFGATARPTQEMGGRELR